jgi:hypothetical protein
MSRNAPLAPQVSVIWPIERSRRLVDASGMAWKRSPGSGLSAEQARFAREHDAYVGVIQHEGIAVMYRDEPGSTHRWVVDRAGFVVDDDTFPRLHPAA